MHQTMLRWVLKGAVRGASVRLFYGAWVRASAVVVILWAVLSSEGPWFAQAGLAVILMVLLVAGVLLLALGTWDLIRDLRHSLHASHK